MRNSNDMKKWSSWEEKRGGENGNPWASRRMHRGNIILHNLNAMQWQPRYAVTVKTKTGLKHLFNVLGVNCDGNLKDTA